MISVHPCRNKLFKARNWIWREGARESEEQEIQKQRWREKRGGWNQPIWKRGDRKSLWQPSIMRFGSLCGFLFTWKGINIKIHTVFSILLTSLPTIIAAYPSFPHSVISASGGSIIWRFIANGVFLPGLKPVRQKCDWDVWSSHMFHWKYASYVSQQDAIGYFVPRMLCGLI